ncbi:hypothetical protein PGT21_017979 [Puccinia graminis f. sp. tritici]|uniref:Uncharacterized protein n=1 Tax=Puccinia graminis f. sp. tritici TaxID=56615 RepID=A0A5B0N338_PUCGR|nr:hypothetical protein PGT21_017979 [Puccinia graminis f. sp. tritici]KAA1122624.1 hypothetical protein PGTUg99_002416 [Puccinia graminis f. sp. tritici]
MIHNSKRSSNFTAVQVYCADLAASASPTDSASAVSNLNTTSLSEISQAIQLDPNSTESTGSIANANQPANLTTSASNSSLDDADVVSTGHQEMS